MNKLQMLFLISFVLTGTKVEAKSLNELKKMYKRPNEIPYLVENSYSKKKETLGKMLFFDPRLSGSNWISCATCHDAFF